MGMDMFQAWNMIMFQAWNMIMFQSVSVSLVLGLWSLVLGPWSLVLGPWSLVLGPWCLVLGPWPRAGPRAEGRRPTYWWCGGGSPRREAGGRLVSGIEFEQNRGSGGFRSSRITRGGSCYTEAAEYQPIFPHGGPNHEELILKTSPKPNSRLDPPPTF